ncbi:MAG: AI-2E family transporter [Oscillochloridaceae bacterium umkhey_bin13]
MSLPPYQTTSIVRPLVIIASAMIIIGAMRLAAPILNPILLALIITLLCNPIYLWLQRRGLPSWLALLLMVIAFLSGASVLSTFIGVSLSQLTAQLAVYQTMLTQQELVLRSWLANYGLVESDIEFFGLINSANLTRVLGMMLTGIGNVLGNTFVVVVMVLFFLVELPAFRQRLRADLGDANPLLTRLRRFGGSVLAYFGVRTYINLVVAVGSTIGMAWLEVPFAPLWGMILFLFSYIPYIGIPMAMIPPVLLTLAEHGFGRAGLVIAIITVVNLTLENLVAPALIGQRLSLSPTVVFIGFFFWTWVLGPPGTFLSMPLMVLLTVLLDSYDETRWLARLMGASSIEALTEPQPGTAPAPAATESQSKADREGVRREA